jgi:TolB-like protein/Flp pilus assembly protein TadD
VAYTPITLKRRALRATLNYEMPVTESGDEAVRCQLAKILSSSGFARNERLSSFLRFVIVQELAGKGDQLKESIIGVEVFGRRPDYDVRQDSVVRTEAGKLRARLLQYYAGDGAADPLVIDLPKGGYMPVFRLVERAPEGRGLAGPKKRWSAPLWAIVACVVVFLAAAGWWRLQHQRVPISIAVLPLLNQSQDRANDYFADGLTSEIIRNLSIIEGLAVRSQTSSFAFKGKSRNVREAGAQLGADYILEGSVLRVGQHLRINAQFVRVSDDFPLWSGRYDRELVDVMFIQDEISRGIVNSLRLKLGSGRRRYETSAAAYDSYVRARAMTIQRGLLGWIESVDLFEQAIKEDPSFAPAYAGVATAHAFRSTQFQWDPAEETNKMRAAAQKAIQLDPLLAEAHDALGMVYARDGQWEQSEESYRRAIKLDPNRSVSHQHFTMEFLLPLGRIEEGLTQLRAAEKSDPLSPDVQYFLYYVLTAAGRFDDAASHCDRLPADFWVKADCQADAQLRHGKIDEATRSLETEVHRGGWRGSEARGRLGCAYLRAGRREEAEELAISDLTDAFNQSRIFACLGDKDRTFDALDRAATGGPFRIGRTLTWPEMALLRGDPRLKALRKRVGLPE